MQPLFFPPTFPMPPFPKVAVQQPYSGLMAIVGFPTIMQLNPLLKSVFF